MNDGLCNGFEPESLVNTFQQFTVTTDITHLVQVLLKYRQMDVHVLRNNTFIQFFQTVNYVDLLVAIHLFKVLAKEKHINMVIAIFLRQITIVGITFRNRRNLIFDLVWSARIFTFFWIFH